MTDESRGHGGVVGPPWSVDVLADLHSGVLDEREAAELWPRVNADPEARAIIEALEATTADLSGLADADVEPIPADVARRLDAALEQERQAREPGSVRSGEERSQSPGPQPPGSQSPGSNVVSIDAARKRRNRRLGWGAGLLTAAAAVVAAVVVTVPTGTDDPLDGMAEPTRQGPTPGATQRPPDGSPGRPGASEPPLAVSSGNLGSAVGEIRGVRDFGPLGGEQRLDACLAAAGIDPGVRPVGVRPVTLNGREAVMVLYTTGRLAEFRIVAFAPDCGPGNPGVLMDKTVGGTGG